MTATTPDSLTTLIDRFDPAAFDAPGGTVRIRLAVTGDGSWDAIVGGRRARIEPAVERIEPDALLRADERTWRAVARELSGGMDAFRAGRLSVRRNLHLGVGFLAATSDATGPGRLTFGRSRTRIGSISLIEAGVGDPVLALHGLGATKASFLPTIAALAPSRRVIAADLPGFGESAKPLGASYDAAFFARGVTALLDALELDRVDLIGNSMGGRVALEVGFRAPDRVRRLALLCPSLAWLRERRWATFVRLLRPELGLIQATPQRAIEGVVRRLVPGATDGWTAAGVDEFLRSYLTARGRAAFYAAARQIYLEEPHGPNGFWPRLEELAPESLFIWGREDKVVPIAFARHVERALPSARHVELDCGHVPQLERPAEAHAAIERFLSEAPRRKRRASRAASKALTG